MKEIPSRNYSAFAVSMAVHVVIMLAMWMYRFNVLGQDEIVVETIFINERLHQEYSQELEQTEIAEQITLVSGGMVSMAVGASSDPPLNRVKIEKLESLQEPIFKLNIAEITAPADGVLAEDLGEGQVTGEVGAMVEGYGEALSRISKELIRLMREQKVLVVWLFDESESMKDDQAEIRQEFVTVYAELEIAQRKVKVLRRKKNEEVLLTSVVGFGKGIHTLTRKPTSDVNEIRAAIDRIPIDDSGEEYTCQAIAAVIDQYHKQAVRQKRKLAVIVVSDESGNGGQFVEATVTKAKRAKVSVYILGRESVFGYPYAQIVWKDPLYGLPFWVQIYRGPETAFPECLQWDGLRARHDAFSAGFGPYEQVRIAKETGGIFFVLPSEEENLSGPGAHEERKFRAYDMKQYQPLLLSRREYLQRRNRSKFRTQIWNVIAKLNPHTDKQLNIKEWHYSIDPVEFHREGLRETTKAVRALALVHQAVKILEEIQPLRAKEDSQRWRAAYDLALAQCLAYRVRLFQYLLALDQHDKQQPKPKNPKTNRWNVRRRREMLPPDKEQVRLTNIDPSELRDQELWARDRYQLVIKEHPGTPWAKRAQYEINMGFGMYFAEHYWDPRYAELKKKKIKPPKQ